MHFAGSSHFDLDLLIVLTAGLFLVQGAAAAAVFAFVQGFFVDLYSGGPPGLSALAYLCVFGGIVLGSHYVDMHHRQGQMLLVGLGALLKRIILLAVMSASLPVGRPEGPFLWISGLSILLTGLAAPPVLRLLDRLKRAIAEEEKETDSGTA